MKVAIKNKSEMKYIETSKIQVGDVSLLELYNLVSRQQDIIKSLLDQIKDSYIVKKDTAYIIKLENELREIDKLEIVAVEKLKYPLRLYELVDGELKLYKKKVVTL
jgi:hypothetical protein